jgi:hypothetical protein
MDAKLTLPLARWAKKDVSKPIVFPIAIYHIYLNFDLQLKVIIYLLKFPGLFNNGEYLLKGEAVYEAFILNYWKVDLHLVLR